MLSRALAEMSPPCFEPDATADGELPPWQVALAYAFHCVLNKAAEVFATALTRSGFKSWVGDSHATTKWLAKKLGDIYPHETVNAHIRRLLDTDFASTRLHETPAQFKERVKKVEQYMNSNAFKAPRSGTGLMGLAKELHERCRLMVASGGERVPK